MAVKRIDHDKLFEPKITKGIIKDFDDLIKKDEDLRDSLKETLKVLQDIKTVKNAKAFKDFTKESEKLEKVQAELVKTEQKLAKLQDKIVKDLAKRKEASDKLTKTQKDRIKLEKQLAEANSSAIDDNNIIKVQLQQQRKINTELAKDKLGLIDAYSKESKELNDLRKRYKNLAVQNKENTKEGKLLLKNITDLDKKLKDVDDRVGQNQRSVGKYEKALSSLNDTLGKLGIIALVTKGLELLGNVIGDNREGALALEILFSKFSETAKVFINSLIESFSGVKNLFSAIGDSFSLIGARLELTFLKIDRAASILPATIARLDEEIKALNSEIKVLEESSVSDSINEITDAFDGNVDATSKAIEEQEKFLNLQLKIRIEIEQQEKALAGLAEKRQILQDMSDDDTIGFVTRAKLVARAQEAAVEFAALENNLALTKERLAIAAVKQDLIRAKVNEKIDLSKIKTGEELRDLLLNEDIAKKVSDTNDQAFTAAFVERRDREAESQAFARDQEEKNRKTRRDAFEQELDILEEFTEKRVASNEKIINSDSASLEERQAARKENQKLEKELFEESVKLILEQGRASIDLRKDLTEAEKEQQKALLTTAAIQEIVNEQDAQEIFNLTRKLDLGEITEKRLKETLKIQQDIAIINEESLKAEEEALLRTQELQEDILLQQRILSGEQIDLEDERLENEIDNLETRIDLLTEDSIERLELEKELNDLLIEEEKKASDERAKVREKERAEREKFINSVIDATLAGLDRANAAENQRLNDQIARHESSLSIQEQRSKDGLTNTLAFEQEQLDKARLEQRRELERQAEQQELIALVQAYLNQFQELSKTDPNTAAFKAFTNTLLAKSIAKGLTGFYEGTEHVGKSLGQPARAGRDGYDISVDGEERIVQGRLNKMLPTGTSNEELVKTYLKSNNIEQSVQDYANGNTWSFPQVISQGMNTDRVEKTMLLTTKKMIRAMEVNRSESKFEVQGLYHIIEQRNTRGKREIIHHLEKNYKMIPKKG